MPSRPLVTKATSSCGSAKSRRTAPPESRGPRPPPPSVPWQPAQFATKTREQQHDECHRAGEREELETVDDPLEHQNSGMPAGRDVMNQNVLVNQIATIAVSTSPPARGSTHPGRPCTRTASTFAVKMP